MILKTIRLIGLSIICMWCAEVSAQEEYRAEIGISGGGAYYLGDANKQLFYNMQPAVGGFIRYKFNPRVAIRADLVNTRIKGDFSSNNTIYPLNKSINSAELVGEFNFFDFEKNKNNRLSKIISPYIFAGIGGMTGLYAGQALPEISIPFGVGIKYKVATRWNLHLQWSNKLLLADNMEEMTEMTDFTVLNNPSGLNGSNKFNNDLLSTLTVGLSFDFWKKQCDCKNGTNTKSSKK